MRTSRASRHASQLLDALSPRKRLTRGAAAALSSSSPVRESDGDARPMTPPDVPKLARFAHSSVSSSTKKRKREDTSPEKTVVESTATKISTRTSPRKAINGDKPKKARRQPAKKIRDDNGDVQIEPPANWEDMYRITQEMRKGWLAPVDTMGCESLAEDKRSPRDRRFQTLVALMLSSQTKDTVTSAAIKNLQEHLPGGLTLEAVLGVDPPVFNELINKVGFHNNKTKFIKSAAEILRDQHKSDIPDTIDGLVSLPGVGPKMAYLCMSAAWGRDEGIGVDVHVHRITNLWGWHKTQNPEQTREALEAWLPREKWHDINHLLVGFGQTYCPPVGRRCDDCQLAQKSLCPSAVVGKKVKQEVVKKDIKIDNGADVKTEVEVKIEEQPIQADPAMPMPHGTQEPQDIEDIGRPRRSRRG